MQTFPANEMNFSLSSPTGEIETATFSPESATDTTPVVIVCHPHPLHGGTMNNKVVTTLVRTFKELNLRTVRFNFRGVGKSSGTFDQGKGEQHDLMTVVEWVKQVCPHAPIWLSGFSFGAYIAAEIATQVAVAKLICVAPPVVNFSMQNLAPITCPWIVVQGDQDEVVSAEAVFAWAENRNPPPVIIRMQGAGHFFHGQLLEMRRLLIEALV